MQNARGSISFWQQMGAGASFSTSTSRPHTEHLNVTLDMGPSSVRVLFSSILSPRLPPLKPLSRETSSSGTCGLIAIRESNKLKTAVDVRKAAEEGVAPETPARPAKVRLDMSRIEVDRSSGIPVRS